MNKKTKAAINQEFRDADTSHLWPIEDRFNVTERAIRQARKLEAANGGWTCELEYRLCLDSLCSEIVNNTKNW